MLLQCCILKGVCTHLEFDNNVGKVQHSKFFFNNNKTTTFKKMTHHHVLLTGLLFVYLLFSTTEIQGKGGGRGGGRGGGFGSIFRSSASSKGGYRSVSGSSRKSFAQKNWKKAVAFGAGAYIGYKVSSKVTFSVII